MTTAYAIVTREFGETGKRCNGVLQNGRFVPRFSVSPFPRTPTTSRRGLFVPAGQLPVKILDLGDAFDRAVEGLILLLQQCDPLLQNAQLAGG